MNRRTWLKQTIAVGIGACLPAARASDPEAPLIVDCHTHFYDPTRPQGVPWPGRDSPLYRKVLPADWRTVAAPHGVTKTVVVEASPWLEDNAWILELAAHERDIVGFIGNLDLLAADFPQQLARFAGYPLFRGLRARDRLDPGALARAGKALAERGLTLDLNGSPGFVARAVDLARAVPDLCIVIDHVGAAGDASRLSDTWREDMRRAAEQPKVFVKVSGMVEQASAAPGLAPRELAAYRPILEHLWSCFGSDRLVFGSNWPVSDRGADFGTVVRIVREFCGEKGAGAAAKIFAENSRAAYRWVERG